MTYFIFGKWKKIKNYEKHIGRVRYGILFIVILEILLTLYSFINPWFIKLFTDDVLMNKRIEMLYVVCLGPLLLFAVYSGGLVLVEKIRYKIVNGGLYKLREQLLKSMIHMSQTEYEKYSTGDLEHLINVDFTYIEKFLNTQIIDYMTGVFFIIFSVCAMAKISILLLCISCLIVPFPYVLMKIIGNINYRRMEKRRELYASYEDFVYGSLGAWKEIKAQVLEMKELRVFYRYRHQIAKYDIESGYREYIGNMVNFIGEIFATRIILYLFGGMFVMQGTLTIGELLVFITYYENFYKQVKLINQYNYQYTNDLPYLAKLDTILAADIEGNDKESQKNLEGDILVKDVSFSYPNSSGLFLQNLNLKIERGSKVAIVGCNGCGKSTFLKLIAGMYSPTSGDIYIGTNNYKSIEKKTLSNSVYTILQNFRLFNLSFAENLGMCCPSSTREDIENACSAVGIHKFIESLPEKYHTTLGENGMRLSGGQRQKVALAKALLAKSDILLMDEISSALDIEAEKAIFENLTKGDRTVIYISHRKESVSMADKIIVMNDGKIVGEGTHTELIKENMYYKTLFA